MGKKGNLTLNSRMAKPFSAAQGGMLFFFFLSESNTGVASHLSSVRVTLEETE